MALLVPSKHKQMSRNDKQAEIYPETASRFKLSFGAICSERPVQCCTTFRRSPPRCQVQEKSQDVRRMSFKLTMRRGAYRKYPTLPSPPATGAELHLHVKSEFISKSKERERERERWGGGGRYGFLLSSFRV